MRTCAGRKYDPYLESGINLHSVTCGSVSWTVSMRRDSRGKRDTRTAGAIAGVGGAGIALEAMAQRANQTWQWPLMSAHSDESRGVLLLSLVQPCAQVLRRTAGDDPNKGIVGQLLT